MVSAQFGDFFQHMFGQQEARHRQYQQAGGNAWAATADQIQCSHYLCPGTLDCVKTPTACPCPSPEDVKCIIPDGEPKSKEGTVVCVRGLDGCASIERKAKP
ncbi:Long chronological lifespan protein 2 [Tulasnella sp. 419]|nr:Long chronological lifespan protein 2 [Tulasnella sp. 419]